MAFTPEQLSVRIKQLRERNKLTQSQLADRAHLSSFTVSKLEQGKIQDPSFFTILALSRALNTTLDQLAGIGQENAYAGSETVSEDILGVYFGLHGVLVDGLEAVFGRMAEDLAIEPGKIEDRFWRYEEAAITGRMSVFDFEQAIAFDLGVSQRSLQLRKHYLASCVPNKRQFDRLFSYKQKGKKIGLLTNSFPGFLDDLFGEGILPYSRSEFDMVVDSSKIGAAKPFAGIYEAAERAADLLPNKLLLVDDTPSHVEAAKARNWQGHVLRT